MDVTSNYVQSDLPKAKPNQAYCPITSPLWIQGRLSAAMKSRQKKYEKAHDLLYHYFLVFFSLF
jgi:hypothetical protein